MPGRCWCGGCRRSAAGFRDDGELPRRRRRAGSLDLVASSPCACRKTRPTFSTVREAPSSSITAGSASLLRVQVLEDQGILGRNEIAERDLVKRKLPEEREN